MDGLGFFLPTPPWRLIISGVASCSREEHARLPIRALSELFGLPLLPTRLRKKRNMEERPKIRD